MTRILKEVIGTSYIYHNTVKINIIFKIDELEENAQLMHRIAIPVHEYCARNECQNSKYLTIQSKIRQVGKSIQKLKTILHKQVRRGLINAIGSISKILFGTLDSNDLNLINKNIDELFVTKTKLVA